MLKKPRILYITCNSFLWGDNRALLNILDGVILNGITPMVVIGTRGNLCKELDKRKISYQIIKNYFAIYPPLRSLKNIFLFFPRLVRTLLYNKIAEREIIKLACNFNPDIIHSNVGPIHIGFQIAKFLRIPHIWHIREYQDLDFRITPLFSMNGFIKKVKFANNYNIAISKGIFKHFSMNNNSKIIFDGVLSKDEVRFNAQKENYFLFTGRLSEGKGVDNLIDAFTEFSRFDYKTNLFIVGSGTLEYEKKLKQKVSNLNLEDRILFLGFRTDVFDLMAKATALIVPSHFEGFGFITAEAMFNGCLVIGNNTGGTKEILEEEHLGILYSGHDELVATMKMVIEDGIEEYFLMIEKAQKMAVTIYSKEQNTKEIYQFYQDILNKK